MVDAVDATQVRIPDTDLDDDPTYDPFRVLDEGQGAGEPNPYPTFHAKRDPGIELLDMREALGLAPAQSLPSHLEDVPPTFTAYSHAAVTEVLADADRFSSRGYADFMGLVFGRSILEMDDPEHRRHRALVAQAFRPKVLRRWESELIAPVIHALIDSFAERGHADLQSEFTFVYPVQVISGLLGVPLGHWEWYRRRAVEVISLVQNYDRAIAAAAALQDYFRQIIHLRREQPRGDLISELVLAEIDGHRLTDDEILPFLMLLSPAGAETTFRSTGNLLYGLLTHPDQHAEVRERRTLVPKAIEEAIRWEPPLLYIQRYATRDTTVSGVDIPAEATVGVNLGSANHDPEVFGRRADEFDIHRANLRHVAFATGPHMCLGMHLARMEMLLACNALFDRLPGLRLDPAQAEDTFVDGIVFRSPNQLPVTWDAA